MNLRWAVLSLIFLFPTISFGGNLTNPALSIQAGKGSIGIEYNSFSHKMKPDDEINWNKVSFDMNQIYLKGSYGLFEGNEVYLRIGMADVTSGKAFGDGSDFEDSFKFSATIGIKQSFEIAPKVRLGGTLQYSYFSDYEDETSYTILGLPVTEKIEVKSPRELNAAIAVSYIGQSFAPYGGITASWRGFDADITTTLAGVPFFSASTEYKGDGTIGGIVGIEIFGRNFKGNIEAQIFKKTSVGIGVSYLF